jgi:putative FmdB family regulatory protein
LQRRSPKDCYGIEIVFFQRIIVILVYSNTYIHQKEEAVMPIYEFTCRECGKEYEELVSLRPDEPPPPCPACRSKDVGRRMSVFGSMGGAGFGGCGPSGFT